MANPVQPGTLGDLPLQQETGAAENLSRILSGTKNLVANPGLVQALSTSRATPEQAQAIDQFLTGLDAQKQVSLASSTGAKIRLDASQQSALGTMGVPYQSVLYTQQDAINDYATHLEQTQSVAFKRDAQGNPLVDPSGNLQVEPAKKHKRGLFGQIVHDVTHNDVTDIGGKGLSVLNKGWNIVESAVTDQRSNANSSGGVDINAEVKRAQEMQDNGYDASNPFSILAFDASGKAHLDTTGIENAWNDNTPGMFGWDGSEAVDQAKQFSDDPTKWRQGILNDPNLTPEQAAEKLQSVADSKQFQNLVARVNAKRATIGNQLASTLGVDPVKHPEAFKWTSVGLDVAASFALDPATIGLGYISNVKRTQLGIKGLADANGISKILDTTNTGFYAKRAQNSVQRFAEHFTPEILSAEKAGDQVKVAQLTAQATTENPALGQLLPDFLGRNKIQTHLVGENEVPVLKQVSQKGELPFVYGPGEALDTYDKAADYLISKNALLRLTTGRAAVESSLMPGAVSSFGLRKLRGGIASWQVGRDLSRVNDAEASALTLKNADPAKWQAHLTNKDLPKLLPQADNAYDAGSGGKIAEGEDVAQEGAASQARGLTPTERGLVNYNIRRYGQATVPKTVAGRTLGWASPTAVAARARLGARRFSTLLPRDTTIELMGSNGADVVDRMAKTYLTKGDAALLRAQYTLGDAGTRKSLIEGLMDQLGHASGMTRSQEGRDIIEQMKTEAQRYSSAGDEVVIDGNNVALHGGQVRAYFRLPSFGQFQEHAAKLGLVSGTLGRPLASKYADAFGGLWRLGALMQPRTAIRAGIESWLNAAIKGDFGKSLRAKALLQESGQLSGDVLGRTRFANALFGFGPVAKTGQFYRHILLRGMDDETAEILMRDLPEILPDVMARYTHSHILADVNPAGVDEATAITQDGLAPARLQFDLSKDAIWGKEKKIRTGFEMQPTEGVEGADRYSNALAQRVDPTPEVARAAVEALKSPNDSEAIGRVIAAIEAPEAKNLTDMTAFGKVYWEDGATEASKALTDEQVALGKRQWAQKVVADYKHLLSSRNGQLHEGLADYVTTTGKAPDADWLMEHMDGAQRPPDVLAPTFTAKAANDLPGFVGALQAVEGKAYQWMVERLIQRTTTAPMFAAAYAEEKKLLKPLLSHWAEQGLSPEAADAAGREIAVQRAWERIALMVDDPQLKTQMDIVGRNFFAFSRATTTMIRRWGSTFWQNPAAARRMMLTWEGAVHSGLVYRDQNGQLMFSFPGSGVMMHVLADVGAKIPGIGDIAMYPAADLSGKVTQIIPGSANPFQFSMSPMITIPMQKITQHFPDSHQIWDEIDHVMNGPNGGQSVLETLEPGIARGFSQALSENDRNSMMASAMMSSVANLQAAGLTPKADASSADVDKFLSQVKDGTRSELFIRAVFAPWLFTSPGNVSLEPRPADYAFSVSGAKNLDAEYKEIINDVGGDLGRAKQIFLALHPEGEAYTVPQSKSNVQGASLPATQAALDWMQQNQGFLGKYKAVGAYFLPQNTEREPYSQQAYQAQLELGLRRKKTPAEFYADVRVSGAQTQYYAMQDKYNADKQQALGENNQALASTLDQQWASWKKSFKALNPLFADSQADSEKKRLDAVDKLKVLTQMANSGEVPATVPSRVLSDMIRAYGDYENFIQSHPGTDNVTQAMHSQAAQRFSSYMSGVVQTHSEVQGIYNGVFRQLDSNLDSLTVIQGGGQ